MLAARMQNFSGSATGAISMKVAELKAAGKEIIALNVGEPDFGTPDHIKCAAIKAITDNFTKYTVCPGILELRQAIAAKLQQDNNLKYTVDQICVTEGAKQAIFSTFLALTGPGDEVIVPIPCWVSYTEIIKFTGAKPVFVECKAADGYDLDLEAVAKAITPRTKAIIICSPNNPTGAVYSEATLRGLGELAVKHDFYVIADEIYEKLIYDGEKHFSIGSISPEVWEKTITVNGFSKAYAMTGWRLGYVAANDEVIGGIKKIQSQSLTNPNAITQKAGVEALTGPQYILEQMVKTFAERRSYLLQRCRELPGVTLTEPKGAFYVFPDISSCFGKKYQGRSINNAIDFTELVLTSKCVAFVPGEAFGMEGCIRLTYSNSLENLKTAMDRIAEFIAELED